MTMVNRYLTVDEAISYLDSKISRAVDYHLSIEKLIEDAILSRKVKPVFKFSGFAGLYKYLPFPECQTSVDMKQIAQIQGYFYVVETKYPSDFIATVPFSNLNNLNYSLSEAVLENLISYTNLATYCRSNGDGYPIGLHEGKNHNLPDIVDGYEANIELYNRYPMPDKNDKFTIPFQDSIELSKRDIFIKLDELDDILRGFNIRSSSDLEHELNEAKARISELEKQLEQANQQQIQTDQLSDRSEQSYLTTIGLLLELMTTPKGVENKPPFQSQSVIIAEIEDKGIYGQRKSSLEGRFSDANKAIDNAKKKG